MSNKYFLSFFAFSLPVFSFAQEKGLNACVLLAVGYRHDEDNSQSSKKVRKAIHEIFESF